MELKSTYVQKDTANITVDSDQTSITILIKNDSRKKGKTFPFRSCSYDSYWLLLHDQGGQGKLSPSLKGFVVFYGFNSSFLSVHKCPCYCLEKLWWEEYYRLLFSLHSNALPFFDHAMIITSS